MKVLDFGIAGVCAGNTKDKVEAGTIAYMSPETLGSSSADTSPAIDIWAIGLMFYAMLYGTLPFYGKSEKEFIEKIKHSPLKFPNDTPVTEEGKEILRRMLEKDPKQRLQLIEFMEMDYYQFEEDELE